jgi:hypothetical protein
MKPTIQAHIHRGLFQVGIESLLLEMLEMEFRVPWVALLQYQPQMNGS